MVQSHLQHRKKPTMHRNFSSEIHGWIHKILRVKNKVEYGREAVIRLKMTSIWWIVRIKWIELTGAMYFQQVKRPHQPKIKAKRVADQRLLPTSEALGQRMSWMFQLSSQEHKCKTLAQVMQDKHTIKQCFIMIRNQISFQQLIWETQVIWGVWAFQIREMEACPSMSKMNYKIREAGAPAPCPPESDKGALTTKI